MHWPSAYTTSAAINQPPETIVNMSNQEDHADRIATPTDFASEQFAFHNRQIFDEFIALRVHGVSPYVAYRMVLGEDYADNYAQARIYAIEMNPYYKREFHAQLEATPVSELWNPKVAVHELLSLVRDRFAKESARMSAIKELNVIANITIVDETGKTKAGRNLADFYATEGAKTEVKVEESELPGQTAHTTH